MYTSSEELFLLKKIIYQLFQMQYIHNQYNGIQREKCHNALLTGIFLNLIKPNHTMNNVITKKCKIVLNKYMWVTTYTHIYIFQLLPIATFNVPLIKLENQRFYVTQNLFKIYWHMTLFMYICVQHTFLNLWLNCDIDSLVAKLMFY